MVRKRYRNLDVAIIAAQCGVRLPRVLQSQVEFAWAKAMSESARGKTKRLDTLMPSAPEKVQDIAAIVDETSASSVQGTRAMQTGSQAASSSSKGSGKGKDKGKEKGKDDKGKGKDKGFTAIPARIRLRELRSSKQLENFEDKASMELAAVHEELDRAMKAQQSAALLSTAAQRSGVAAPGLENPPGKGEYKCGDESFHLHGVLECHQRGHRWGCESAATLDGVAGGEAEDGRQSQAKSKTTHLNAHYRMLAASPRLAWWSLENV
eukprot:s771_g3.t1